MVNGDLDVDRMNTFLGGLISLVGPDLYRYKGICAIEHEDVRFVFQVRLCFSCMIHSFIYLFSDSVIHTFMQMLVTLQLGCSSEAAHVLP